MLWGSEFEFLSMLSKYYIRHKDGFLKFGEADFRSKFSDDNSLKNLRLLEDKGIVTRRGTIINVDTKIWVNLFIQELKRQLDNIGFEFQCVYDVEKEAIVFFDEYKQKAEIFINFDPSKYKLKPNIINFCYVDTFETYLFWLNLLLDVNLLCQFVSFINNEISFFNNENIISINYFDGVEDEYISEIYNVIIKNYFNQGGMKEKKLTDEEKDLVKKFTRIDDFLVYGIEIKNGSKLIITKIDRKIVFYHFKQNTLSFTSETIKEIDKLDKLLRNKVSEYRKLTLFNKNQVVENVQKVSSIFIVFIAPINIIVTILTKLGYSFIGDIKNNIWLIITTGVILIVLYIAFFALLIFPAFKLSRFNWDIKYIK